MSDEIDEVLAELHEEFDSPIVVGFVLVGDVMDNDGYRWLCNRTSEGMPTWQRNGMLHDVLYEEES